MRADWLCNLDDEVSPAYVILHTAPETLQVILALPCENAHGIGSRSISAAAGTLKLHLSFDFLAWTKAATFPFAQDFYDKFLLRHQLRPTTVQPARFHCNTKSWLTQVYQLVQLRDCETHHGF